MRAGSEVMQGFANGRKERECAQMVKRGLFAGEVYERKQRGKMGLADRTSSPSYRVHQKGSCTSFRPDKLVQLRCGQHS